MTAFSNIANGTTSSVGTTPVTLGSAISTAGRYRVRVDASNMAAGDQFLLYAEGKVTSGGSAVRIWPLPISNAPVSKFIDGPQIDEVVNQITYKIVKITGTDRTFAYSIEGDTSSSGTVNANVTQWNGTNVATPDTAGYPKVTIKSGTGTGELNLSSGVARANDSSGNAIAPASTALSTTNWTNTRASYLDNLSAGAVALASSLTSLAGIFSGITLLKQWLGALAGKQTADSTALTEIRATGAGSGTYNPATDSQEAIRDQGDSAWITATGFSTLDANGVRSAVGLASANLDTQLAGLKALILNRTTVNVATDSTHFTLVAGSTDDDAYNGLIIVFEDQSTAVQKGVCVVSDYVGSTKGVVLSTAAPFTVSAGDTVTVLGVVAPTAGGGSAPTAVEIADEVETRTLDANIVQLNGSTNAAAKAATFWESAITSGEIASGTPTTTNFIGDASLSTDDSAYVGMLLAFTSGANAGRWRKVTAYVGASRTFTVAAFPEVPAVADTFEIGGKG